MAILDLWYDWLWLVGAALGIATILVTIVYVLSDFLLNERMKTWAKMELVEIFYSAIIIAMAIAALPIIDSAVQGGILIGSETAGDVTFGCSGTPTDAWIPVIENEAKVYRCYNICGPQIAEDLPNSIYEEIEPCHMRLGIWYLREVFDESRDFAFDVYLSYIKTSMIAEFTINIEFVTEKAGFFTFAPWRGFYTMGNTIKAVVFDWAMKIMMLTKFQEVMLRFIATALFPALFVIGAVLRTFTFTRRLGGLLLAMAVAMYFVFPAFYAFGAVVMLDLKNTAFASGDWVDVNPANPSGATDANPAGMANPNPPIANAMYIRGDIQTIGGDGKLSTEEAKEYLGKFEGMSSDQYHDDFLKRMEAGEYDGKPMIQSYDFSAKRKNETEENESLKKVKEAADSWFGSISKEKKMDKFVTFAWERNGPIETLSRLTFWSLFFSLFSVIGTIAAIRSLATTFGGDIEIAGLTRLI